MRTRRFLKSLFALSLVAPVLWANAQTYPARPLTIVVPFPAGGALDTVARVIAEQMRADLGQPVVVDNRAGAGGTIGSALVARAAPDGYTILLGSVATHAIAAGLYAKLAYDPIDDFAPITQLTSSPLVLTTSPQSKAKNVAELIAEAKAQPGRLNYASTGNGTALHIAGEVFRKATGVDVVHVPYGGGAQATSAMLAGEVSYVLGNPQLVVSLIQSGRLRGLAVTGPARLAALPDLPTLKEAGIPGVDITTWFGLWAPKGTPAAVVERLNASARKALAALDALADALSVNCAVVASDSRMRAAMTLRMLRMGVAENGPGNAPAGPAPRRDRSPKSGIADGKVLGAVVEAPGAGAPGRHASTRTARLVEDLHPVPTIGQGPGAGEPRDPCADHGNTEPRRVAVRHRFDIRVCGLHAVANRDRGAALPVSAAPGVTAPSRGDYRARRGPVRSPDDVRDGVV